VIEDDGVFGNFAPKKKTHPIYEGQNLTPDYVPVQCTGTYSLFHGTENVLSAVTANRVMVFREIIII
jgi:hypothetical protein